MHYDYNVIRSHNYELTNPHVLVQLMEILMVLENPIPIAYSMGAPATDSSILLDTPCTAGARIARDKQIYH